VGVKGAWFDNRLNASLAVFRIEQDNVAQVTSEPIIGRPGEFASIAARGTVSRGFEFEVNGELAPGWNATFGASRYVAKDINGADINTNLPQTALKLFTSYTPQSLQELTVGGGANWQNRIYYAVPAYGRIEQVATHWSAPSCATASRRSSACRPTSTTCWTRSTCRRSPATVRTAMAATAR
jgi:outer membrane receptor for ferric coprogen and ferric-rhodotorulic acid